MNQDIRLFHSHLESSKRLTLNSLDGYRRDLEDMARRLEEEYDLTRVADVRPYHLGAYLQWLRSQNRSAATISRRMVSMRAFFHYLSGRKAIEDNPAVDLESPRSERKPPRALGVSDVERLLEAPETDTPSGIRDRAMLEVLYAGGMRVTELVMLDLPDLRLDLNLLTCRGSKGKERFVQIGSLSREWMIKYVEQARPQLLRDGVPESAVFVSHLGRRMTRQGFWKLIKKYAAASGISTEVTPHTLRHSFAYHLLDNGADLRSVQEMMGHADLTATQVYQASAKPKLKDVYNSFHPRSSKPERSDPTQQ